MTEVGGHDGGENILPEYTPDFLGSALSFPFDPTRPMPDEQIQQAVDSLDTVPKDAIDDCYLQIRVAGAEITYQVFLPVLYERSMQQHDPSARLVRDDMGRPLLDRFQWPITSSSHEDSKAPSAARVLLAKIFPAFGGSPVLRLATQRATEQTHREPVLVNTRKSCTDVQLQLAAQSAEVVPYGGQAEGYDYDGPILPDPFDVLMGDTPIPQFARKPSRL